MLRNLFNSRYGENHMQFNPGYRYRIQKLILGDRRFIRCTLYPNVPLFFVIFSTFEDERRLTLLNHSEGDTIHKWQDTSIIWMWQIVLWISALVGKTSITLDTFHFQRRLHWNIQIWPTYLRLVRLTRHWWTQISRN